MKCILFTNARNENRILEWIAHHLNLNFDYIHIFDHCSNVPINETIPDIQNVTIERNNDETMVKHKFMHKAIQISKNKKYDWMLYLDADEYLYLKKDTIQEYIINFQPNIKKIGINWVCFGSNYKDKFEANESMFEQFQLSNKSVDRHIKVLVNVECLLNIPPPNPHSFICKNEFNNIYSSEGIIQEGFSDYNHPWIYQHLNCHQLSSFIAHYCDQDYATFSNRKIKLRRDDISICDTKNLYRPWLKNYNKYALHNNGNNEISNLIMYEKYNVRLKEKINEILMNK